MPLIERDLSGDTCEVADATVASSDYVRSLGSDAVVVTELFVRHPLFARVLVDVVVVDDLIRQSFAHVILADSVVLTEAISLRLWVQHVRTVADAADVADTLAVVLSSLDVHVSDEIATHDVTIPAITYGYPNRFVHDGAVVTDALVIGKARDVVISDTVDVADAIGRGFSTAIVLSDTIAVADQLARAQVAHRPRLDVVGLTDFLTATIPELADRNPFNRAPGYL